MEITDKDIGSVYEVDFDNIEKHYMLLVGIDSDFKGLFSKSLCMAFIDKKLEPFLGHGGSSYCGIRTNLFNKYSKLRALWYIDSNQLIRKVTKEEILAHLL